MKIRPVGAELFHAEGQTDVTKLSLFAILRTRLQISKYRSKTACICYRQTTSNIRLHNIYIVYTTD